MSLPGLHVLASVLFLVVLNGTAKVWAIDEQLGELRYDMPVQPAQPAQIIVVDDKSRNQVITPAPPTTADGHTYNGNTICVNRDEYEEFMGWKYGRNQDDSSDRDGNRNRGYYRRNGFYGRGYRRGRY